MADRSKGFDRSSIHRRGRAAALADRLIGFHRSSCFLRRGSRARASPDRPDRPRVRLTQKARLAAPVGARCLRPSRGCSAVAGSACLRGQVVSDLGVADSNDAPFCRWPMLARNTNQALMRAVCNDLLTIGGRSGLGHQRYHRVMARTTRRAVRESLCKRAAIRGRGLRARRRMPNCRTRAPRPPQVWWPTAAPTGYCRRPR